MYAPNFFGFNFGKNSYISYEANLSRLKVRFYGTKGRLLQNNALKEQV